MIDRLVNIETIVILRLIIKQLMDGVLAYGKWLNVITSDICTLRRRISRPVVSYVHNYFTDYFK